MCFFWAAIATQSRGEMGCWKLLLQMLLETLILDKIRPRLDGRSTIINWLIWVEFANTFDADCDFYADHYVYANVDADATFSAEELTEHTQEELYGGGTSDKTISTSQVFFLSFHQLLQRIFLGPEKQSFQYNRPEATFEGVNLALK